MTAPVDASIYSDLGSLTALKREARAEDPNALRQVARQFESVFAKMMLTSMRQASFGDPIFGSDQTEFYQGMFDDQLSLELTKGRGLGLADMLVRQLQHTTGAPAPADDKPAELKMPGQSTTGFDIKERGDSFVALASAPRGTPDSSRLQSTSNAAPLLNLNAAEALSSVNRFTAQMLAGNKQASTFRTPESPEDFVKQLWPCAEEAGKALGIDPTHLLAQAALETGWGRSLPCDANGNPSFNFFGIKTSADWSGDSVSVKTLEFEGGVPVPKQERFRAYDSAEESFRDYVALLRDNPRYAAALNTGNDAKAFATALQRGGYATDPAYAQKIATIAQNLAKSSAALKSSGGQPTPSTPGTL